MATPDRIGGSARIEGGVRRPSGRGPKSLEDRRKGRRDLDDPEKPRRVSEESGDRESDREIAGNPGLKVAIPLGRRDQREDHFGEAD
jgi:hypothetical protein